MSALSILDLVRIREGQGPAEALQASREIAQLADELGFKRYWVAEHHNAASTASAATSLVIAHLAAATSRIRVGAGGIMLPNHSPLIIAEQFGTLEHLFPGRIDLGLGRAPGTDQATLRAMRRGPEAAERFPQDVLELQSLLAPARPGQTIRAIPGCGTEVPLWILGSSHFGAMLAADLGLPYAFASHFAPNQLMSALRLYRERFKPSAQLERPYAMVAANIIAADSDEEARRLATSLQMAFTDLLRGNLGPAKAPIENIEAYWSAWEKTQANQMLTCSTFGSPDTIRAWTEEFLGATQADELIIVSDIHDMEARRRSLMLTWEALAEGR